MVRFGVRVFHRCERIHMAHRMRAPCDLLRNNVSRETIQMFISKTGLFCRITSQL